mmetsp:Transcript_18701/g.31171  ORF Transcript_18701/g.31171 Transcript_18701/m.31171 type:complete len:400 (+) Transcript_18701:671-1870(+)
MLSLLFSRRTHSQLLEGSQLQSHLLHRHLLPLHVLHEAAQSLAVTVVQVHTTPQEDAAEALVGRTPEQLRQGLEGRHHVQLTTRVLHRHEEQHAEEQQRLTAQVARGHDHLLHPLGGACRTRGPRDCLGFPSPRRRPLQLLFLATVKHPPLRILVLDPKSAETSLNDLLAGLREVVLDFLCPSLRLLHLLLEVAPALAELLSVADVELHNVIEGELSAAVVVHEPHHGADVAASQAHIILLAEAHQVAGREEAVVRLVHLLKSAEQKGDFHGQLLHLCALLLLLRRFFTAAPQDTFHALDEPRLRLLLAPLLHLLAGLAAALQQVCALVIELLPQLFLQVPLLLLHLLLCREGHIFFHLLHHRLLALCRSKLSSLALPVLVVALDHGRLGVTLGRIGAL